MLQPCYMKPCDRLSLSATKGRGTWITHRASRIASPDSRAARPATLRLRFNTSEKVPLLVYDLMLIEVWKDGRPAGWLRRRPARRPAGWASLTASLTAWLTGVGAQQTRATNSGAKR